MSMAFYKTSAAPVMEALAAHTAHVEQVRALGQDFANHFGGKLLAQNDAHGYRVAGLVFNPPKDRRLWTVADQKKCGMQRPRTSITGATKEEKGELKTLQAEWHEKFPTEATDFAPTLKEMGTDWGNLFLCGFGMFEHGGEVYVTTSASMGDCMTEIVASEYSAAKAAHRSEPA